MEKYLFLNGNEVKYSIHIGLYQGYFGLDDQLNIRDIDNPELIKRCQDIYNLARKKEVDILIFPDYFSQIFHRISLEMYEDTESRVIAYGLNPNSPADREAAGICGNMCLVKLGRKGLIPITKRHLTPLEQHLAKKQMITNNIIDTSIGPLAVLTGTDFLMGEVPEKNVTGIVIISYSYGTKAFIKTINKVFSSNKNLQFIAFTNAAAHTPEQFHYARQFPLAVSAGPDSEFWQYYDRLERGDLYYRKKKSIDQKAAFEYLQNRLYTYGNSGLFCRRCTLHPGHKLKKRAYTADAPVFTYQVDNDPQKVVRSYQYPSLEDTRKTDRKPDLVQLCTRDEEFTDYLLVFEYNHKKYNITFESVIPRHSVKPLAVPDFQHLPHTQQRKKSS